MPSPSLPTSLRGATVVGLIEPWVQTHGYPHRLAPRGTFRPRGSSPEFREVPVAPKPPPPARVRGSLRLPPGRDVIGGLVGERRKATNRLAQLREKVDGQP